MEFISNQEKQQLLFEFNNTKADYPNDKTVIDLFQEQVGKTPDAIAVVFQGKELTYRNLDDLSTQVSYTLCEDYSIKKGDLIGVQLERSEWQIISIIAILKSGGVYVPIDSRLPGNRKAFIIEDTGLKLLITEISFVLELDFYSGNVFSIDVEFEPKIGVTSSKVELLSSDLAYIIYTSGSTGKPKGVMIGHASLTNYLTWSKKYYLEEGSKNANFGLFTSLSFDLTITSLFLPLISGGALKIFDSGLDIASILVNYFQSDLDYIKLTPAHISLLNTLDIAGTNVKVAIVGGDKLEAAQVATLKKLNPEIRIYNEYGPTESTVGCTVSEVFSAGEEISIGKPISNTQIFIIDNEQELQPIGVIGEICIGGDGLARGYWNNEDLTGEKFVDNPFQQGTKIYKTGDLGRWTKDGKIQYLGRSDHQVKIRGYRVELGEIVSEINKHEAVQICEVLTKENKQNDIGIVAYVVPNLDNAYTVRQILNAAENKTALEFEAELYEMENGLSMYSYNKSEVKMLYDEVFKHKTYDRNGITIPPNACIVDVGANVGAFSIYAMVTFDNPEIYSFEPLSPIYDLLKKNTALYKGNIKIFNFGISDKEEEALFDYYPYATVLSGRHYENYKIKDAVKKFISNSKEDAENIVTDTEMEELLSNRLITKEYKCKLKPLSKVIAENGIQKIDLLKVDAENAELDILNGISEENWKIIDQIVLEVYNEDNRLEKVKEMLISYGFNVAVNQSDELNGTIFFDIYAIKQKNVTVEKRDALINANWYNTDTLINSIRKKLYQDLPDYMMPSEIILLENMPLTSNGKLDRKALLSISAEDIIRKEYVAPRNQIEEKLVGLIAKILNCKESEIGINHNFFDLGMNSLKFINMVNSIKTELDLTISISLLFEFPNVNEVANEIYNIVNATQNHDENPSENLEDLSEKIDDFLSEIEG